LPRSLSSNPFSYFEFSAPLSFTHLRSKVDALENLQSRSRYIDEEKTKNIIKIKENLPIAYKKCDDIDKQIEKLRQITYQSESKITKQSFGNLYRTIFKVNAASLRDRLDKLSLDIDFRRE
jgi:hypothetical protein